MTTQHINLVLCLLLLVAMMTACGQSTTHSTTEQTTTDSTASTTNLKVVATTGQVADAVKHIGGEAIDLTAMFGPGVDPHLYVPTENDVIELSEAEVVFYNGLHLEAQMERALTQMRQRGVKVIALGDALPADRLLSWDDNYPHDPHVWNDPELWSLGVEVVRDTLIEADPANAELYRQNATAYLTEIAETHAYIQAQVARIPADKRVMITAHDAFGYYARTYGFEVAGLQGISTESEASTADVQQLAEFIVERQIPAIFIESSVPPRNIEAVQAAVKAKGFEVVIGGELFSDALGNPGTPEGSYTGMLRHNTDTLANALGEPGS